jgi:hypothetical protein
MGILPGLGGVIGTGDHARALRLRAEINSLIWLVGTALGASVILWNRTFIGLWVGADHFAGSLPNLLIVVLAMQLAFIRSDGNVIDLTLKMSQKVLLGLLSVGVSIAAAAVMVAYFRQGVVGLCLGIMAGRLIISIGYPALIGRFLGAPLSSQLTGLVRPALITALIFAVAANLDQAFPSVTLSGIRGWVLFMLYAAATGGLLLLLSFYTGLSAEQREAIARRVRIAMGLGGATGPR